MNKQNNKNCSDVVIGNSDYDQVLFDSEKIVNGEIQCLITGTSGSGKSYLTRNIIESLYAKKLGIISVIDSEGEYLSLREKYDFVILGVDKDTCDILITKENVHVLVNRMFDHKINIIVDLKYTDDTNRREILSSYIEAIIDRRDCSPLQIVIDETSRFASKNERSIANIKCTEWLKRLAQFGRMREISTFYSSQKITQLPKNISVECNTKIIGRCSNDIDTKLNSRTIGEQNTFEIKSLKNYEFLAFGSGFINGNFDKVTRFKSLTPKSKHGIMKGSLFSLPKSETVTKWIELMCE